MIRQASDLTAEMERQRQILLREMPERLALTALAFALATIFADPEIVLVLWAVNLLTELAANAALARAGRSRRFYVLALALTVVIETAYVLAAGLAWYDPDSHAKAFAVGMAVVTLMHLATVRSIHLPIGLAGLAGAGAGRYAGLHTAVGEAVGAAVRQAVTAAAADWLRWRDAERAKR